MNKFIIKELKKIKTAIIPQWDENTTEMIISKKDNNPINISLGKCYIIEVENYIIHPYEGFTLHIEWNKGIVPKHKYMKCEVLQIMGKMIKIEALGYDWENQCDILEPWSGWLPSKSVKILREV